MTITNKGILGVFGERESDDCREIRTIGIRGKSRLSHAVAMSRETIFRLRFLAVII